jgi:hypothetical protein
MPHRSPLVIGLLPALLLAGCLAEPVGIGPDVAPDDPDAAVSRLDVRVPDDGPGTDGPASRPCTAPLGAGVVVSTSVPATEPSPGVIEHRIEGLATYHGDVIEPLAMNPAFDRQLDLAHADGSTTIIQYFLPLDLEVPIATGLGYSALYRQVIGFEGQATGLVLSRQTSGLAPLVLVIDLGEYGRAFAPDEPALSPLRVYPGVEPICLRDDPLGCGGHLWGHLLTFDSSTGGAVTAVSLEQGERAVLPIFGFDHHVVALSASTRSQPCPDAPVDEDAYLSVLAE